MKTAEQIAEKLWEKHAAEFSSRCNLMTEESFLLACREFGKEYGEAVRQKAADTVRPRTKRPCDCETCDCGNSGNLRAVTYWDESNWCAAAIERMELP